MKTVTQNILYRQALISYANKYGVTKAAIRYKTNRQYILEGGREDRAAALAAALHPDASEYIHEEGGRS